LAGDVYPRPAFAVRWRLWLFALFVKLQRYIAIAPRCEIFSLLEPNEGEETGLPQGKT
jgi:hypothetical protein